MIGRLATWAMLVLACLVTLARGEPAGAGFASPQANEPVHGWTISRDPDERDYVVIHVPPRRPTPGVAPMRASSDGTARGVVRTKSVPTAIGALGATAYLTFEPTGADAPIPVMAVTAIRTGMGELWSYVPTGRLEARAAIPVPRSAMLGLVGTQAGLMALTESRQNKGEFALHVYQRGAWGKVTPALPEAWGGQSAAGTQATSVRLVHAADGTPTVMIWTGKECEFWQATITPVVTTAQPEAPRDEVPMLTSPPAAAMVDSYAATWKRVLTTAWTVERAPEVVTFIASAGEPFAVLSQSPEIKPVGNKDAAGAEAKTSVPAGGDALDSPSDSESDSKSVANVMGMLWTLRSGGVSMLAAFDASTSTPLQTFSVVPMVDASRVVVLSPPASTTKPKMKSANIPSHTVSEYSILTGREWYTGPTKNANPISRGDFRIVVAVLIALMAMVLFVVLRPNKSPDAIALPEHASLAEPTRRFIAGLIDIAAAVIVGTNLTGLDLGELFTISTWLSDQILIAIISIAGFGFVAGTVGEALTGRSLGKLITGCEVISIVDREQPDVSFSAALVRNAIKWGLPPVAVLGLFDPGLRHKGDDFARTAVVIWEYPEEDDMGE